MTRTACHRCVGRSVAEERTGEDIPASRRSLRAGAVCNVALVFCTLLCVLPAGLTSGGVVTHARCLSRRFPQLEVAVKFARACQNGPQRLFHIRRLGDLALDAGVRCQGNDWGRAGRIVNTRSRNGGDGSSGRATRQCAGVAHSPGGLTSRPAVACRTPCSIA